MVDFLSELHAFQIKNLISLKTIFKLASHGKQIIGWDNEWGVEWTQNTLKYGGAAAYQKLNRRHTKMPQKIVLLMHDIAFRTPEASEELRTFVRLANESGYIFSTIDQYETDNL